MQSHQEERPVSPSCGEARSRSGHLVRTLGGLLGASCDAAGSGL